MSRIIVLGSEGFIGTALRKKLLDTNVNAKFMLHKKNKKLSKNDFYGDILDKKIPFQIFA